MPRKPPRPIQVGDRAVPLFGVKYADEPGHVVTIHPAPTEGQQTFSIKLDNVADAPTLILPASDFLDLERCAECDCYKANACCPVCPGLVDHGIDQATKAHRAECQGNRPTECRCHSCHRAVLILGPHRRVTKHGK
jgi:hypothetical protein